MSTFRLQNRIKEILDLLRAAHPGEVDELLLLQNLLASKQTNPDTPYAHVRTPSAAVLMLMHELKVNLSKKQVYEELNKRGYAIDSTAKKGLVNDAINHLIETGKLTKHGKGERSAAIVGLPQTRKS